MMPVDLRSDTVTRPSAAMRQAIANAEVGDDVFGEDPTVLRLERMGAALLGKEAAMFVPSGTMANQLAIRLHTRPGDEMLCEAGAHPFNYEAGGPAMLSGVTVRLATGERGLLRPHQVSGAFRPDDPHFAPLKLVTIEDTANRGGGTVHGLDALDGLAAAAHEGGAKAHLDGARLMNAVVASGTSAARRVRDYDTVSLCLSKGLGAPVGSLLAGSAAALHVARRYRKALGGGMRQAGILAAAGVYALEHNVDRLAEDHVRAAILADGLRDAGYKVRTPDTNMVFFQTPDAAAVVAAVAEHGIRCLTVAHDEIRLVLHLDIDDNGVERAISAFRLAR